MEAETVASTHRIKDATWIRKLMFEVNDPYYRLINVCVDNQAVIYFGNAAIDHTHAKHIDLQYHYICNGISQGIIRLWYCPTQYNPADLFTKALHPDRHLYLMCMLGMRRLEEVC